MTKQDKVLIGSQMRDFQRWEDLSQNIPHADVYFLPQYAQIYERKGDGSAHCFVYCSVNGLVLYPFLLPRILTIPIDQRYSETEMEYICNVLQISERQLQY